MGTGKSKATRSCAFCDRNCKVIAPFISAPGNQNESPLLRDALPEVTRIADSIGLDLRSTIVSLDGVYDCSRNRKAIFNRGMVPNINPNPRGGNRRNAAASRSSTPTIFKERFNTIERVFGWEDKFRRLLLGSNASASCITPLNHWPMPPLSGVMRTNYQETPVSQRLLADFWWWRFEVDFAGWTDFTGRSAQLPLISRLTRKPRTTHWEVSFRS